MPLNLRASEKIQSFNAPVSYKISDRKGKLLDARNVFSIQNRLETRFGISRYNSVSLGGAIQSVSFFAKTDGTKYTIVKVGSSLYSVSRLGESVEIKSGLNPLEVHRGITGNDRHIIAVGTSGLYAYDGLIFTQLGQAKPSIVPTLIASSGGSLITGNNYKVAVSYYSSEYGFESNYAESIDITTTTPNLRIQVTNLPTSAENGFIDRVRIYLKNVTTNSPFLLVDEINLGTSSYFIQAESLSTIVPQFKNSMPPTSAKYLLNFNSKTVLLGLSDYPNEVRFSETDQPDAYSEFIDNGTLVIQGRGEITGGAIGLFSDTVLDPFLVIFKRKSTSVYSEIGGIPKFVTLDDKIGCVSHDTIQVKNGVVYFLSEEGWRAIANGRFAVGDDGEALTLGRGDIDDIFKTTGFAYEVDRASLNKTFSVYYPTLDQYMTWMPEGVGGIFSKTYVYEFGTAGFTPYEFSIPATCACLGESPEGRDIVLIGTSDGYLLSHSSMEKRSDIDVANTEVPIAAYAILPWYPENGDYDASYNYRELIVKAVSSDNPVTVRTFLNYNRSSFQTSSFDFSTSLGGFVLDESVLDQDSFGDERSLQTSRADINEVGENIAIGFYQEILGANIGLVSLQIDLSKNGNRNISSDDDSEEGGFDEESGQYFPSVSQSVKRAEEILKEIQELIATGASGLPPGILEGGFIEGLASNSAEWKSGSYSGFSSRFNTNIETTGLDDTLRTILDFAYLSALVSLSASGSGTLREKGSSVTASTLTASVTKRSTLITRIQFFKDGVSINDNNPPSITGSGNTVYNWTGSFSDNTTFRVDVTDTADGGSGPSTTQSSATFNFVYPYYQAASTPGKTAAQVALIGGAKQVISNTNSRTVTFTVSVGDIVYFAYPAAYGPLTSIKDQNNFEASSGFADSIESITGLDGTSQSYRLYKLTNTIGIAGTTTYTFIK